ncbi:MAG: hypothetical protein WC926_03485 [Candidatus Paceibacterota bacterium]|jgi:hypothetical protein
MKKISIPSFNTEKIKNLLGFLGERSFLIFISLFLISGYLTYFLLYQPIKSKKDFLVDEKANSVQFDDDSFNASLEQWKIKEKRLAGADSKNYPDVFPVAAGTNTPAVSSTAVSTASSTASSTVRSAASTTAPAINNR